MARNKNKPKKGAAATSPAAIPVGQTETIVEHVAAATPLPTFTQIGMLGILGSAVTATVTTAPEEEQQEPLPATEAPATEAPATEAPAAEAPAAEPPVAEAPAAEAPAADAPDVPVPAAEEPDADVAELEAAVTEPLSVSDVMNTTLTESLPSPTKPEEATGSFYGLIKNFFRSIGGSIHR